MNEYVEIKYRLRGETARFATASERRPLSNFTLRNVLKSFGRPPRFRGRPTPTPDRLCLTDRHWDRFTNHTCGLQTDELGDTSFMIFLWLAQLPSLQLTLVEML